MQSQLETFNQAPIITINKTYSKTYVYIIFHKILQEHSFSI